MKSGIIILFMIFGILGETEAKTVSSKIQVHATVPEICGPKFCNVPYTINRSQKYLIYTF